MLVISLAIAICKLYPLIYSILIILFYSLCLFVSLSYSILFDDFLYLIFFYLPGTVNNLLISLLK